MSKKNSLNKLYTNQHLNSEESEELMLQITEGSFSETEIAIILMFYKTHSVTVTELSSFRKVLLEKSLRFTIPFDAIDVCGTGGDEKDTFNISTLSALVIAASGYKVVKHGNYGVSSVSGSSNILEHFGYKFTNKTEVLLDQIEEHHICFLHAPLFHPALKHVAPVRKSMGTKTIFNLLGPLVNPCNITHQFIGVNSLETMRTYNYLLQKTLSKYYLVHSTDGYDEISLTAPYKIVGNHHEQLLHPNEAKFPLIEPEALHSGGSIESASKIFMNVLTNTASPSQKNAVIINSAYAIQLINNKSIEICIQEATEAIESKKALNTFNHLIQK
ncbi:MAG: anthranilate phosphoribosyltransferase [Bacteroidota bacterium]|nr:anthranilate phosphoribosyltransferase [Bacteroidota bacterium]